MDTSRTAVAKESEGSVRFWLFLAVGLTIPFYAFPVVNVLGKRLDLATLLAGFFVLASLSRRTLFVGSWRVRVFLASVILVPLLCLIPPGVSPFDLRRFVISYAHWILVTFFFLSATTWRLSDRQRRGLMVGNLAAAAIVALFALYQLLGIPRGWPATGQRLAGFQRQPFVFMSLGDYVRPTSVFLEPSFLGGYLVWNLLLGARLLRLEFQRSFWRVFGVVGTVVIFLALLATISWGAYADLFAGAVVGAGLAVRHRDMTVRKLWAYALILLLVLLLAGVSGPGRSVLRTVGTRLEWLVKTGAASGAQTTEGWNSSQLRSRNVAHMARLFLDHPLRGIGLGQFASYPQDDPDFHVTAVVPWCGWVGIAAAAGIMGPFVLLGAVLLVFWRARTDRSVDALVAALLAVAVVQQIHTGSFIDLWWWYPLSLAAVWAASSPAAEPRGRDSLAGDVVRIGAPTSAEAQP